MKRILLFFGLLFLANILIGQTTQKDTVNVKPFEDLTLVTDGTVDTSDQFLMYDISAGLFSYRLSLGELLKKAIDVPNIVGSSQIVNGSILDTDISGSAGIGLNKLATTAAGRLLLTDSGGAGTWVSGTPGYGLTISGTSMLVDTSSATGLVSKSRLTNALDDIGGGGSGNASGRALQSIAADGTDTLDFGGTSYSVDYWQIDLSAVTNSTLNFTNPNTSIVPTYNLHFTQASTDTVTFANTFLDANLDTIASHVFEQGQIVPIYYYNSNYYTNYLTLSTTTDTTAGGGGGGGITANPLNLSFESNWLMYSSVDSFTVDANGVSEWTDLMRNNWDLTQTNNLYKPDSLAGKIDYNGNDDHLILDSAIWDSYTDTAFTIIAIFERTSITGTPTTSLYAVGGSSIKFNNIDGSTYNIDAYLIGNPSNQTSLAFDTLNVNTTYLLVFSASLNTDGYVRINGVQETTVSSPTTEFKEVNMGIGANGALTFENYLGNMSFFGVLNKKLSTAEAGVLEDELNAIFSIY